MSLPFEEVSIEELIERRQVKISQRRKINGELDIRPPKIYERKSGIPRTIESFISHAPSTSAITTKV